MGETRHPGKSGSGRPLGTWRHQGQRPGEHGTSVEWAAEDRTGGRGGDDTEECLFDDILLLAYSQPFRLGIVPRLRTSE